MLQRDADRAASLAHDHCESAGRILAEFLGERVESLFVTNGGSAAAALAMPA